MLFNAQSLLPDPSLLQRSMLGEGSRTTCHCYFFAIWHT